MTQTAKSRLFGILLFDQVKNQIARQKIRWLKFRLKFFYELTEIKLTVESRYNHHINKNVNFSQFQLPSQKKVTDIKWFSVFDISTQNNFGDVYIPSYFEPPGHQVGLSILLKIFLTILFVFMCMYIQFAWQNNRMNPYEKWNLIVASTSQNFFWAHVLNIDW